MARKASFFPSYLPHKQSGPARVRISGRDCLLGPDPMAQNPPELLTVS